jgi:hypothetical protein
MTEDVNFEEVKAEDLPPDDRAPGRGVGAAILSSVGCSIRLPQSAE